MQLQDTCTSITFPETVSVEVSHQYWYICTKTVNTGYREQLNMYFLIDWYTVVALENWRFHTHDNVTYLANDICTDHSFFRFQKEVNNAREKLLKTWILVCWNFKMHNIEPHAQYLYVSFYKRLVKVFVCLFVFLEIW